MEGTIIKGKKLGKHMQDLVFETLGCFDSNDDYFVAKTSIGILIFTVRK